MEELKSTDSLDREIEADARKKADKIQKNTAAAIEHVKSEWRERLETALIREKERFSAQLDARKAEIAARLVLDKRRLEYEYSERSLHDAARAFLSGLSRQDLLQILERIFVFRIQEAFQNDFTSLHTAQVSISLQLLSRTEFDGIFAAVFSKSGVGCSSWEFRETRPQDTLWGETDVALIFDMPAVRINVSARAEVEELLLVKRTELSAALLGDNNV
ncbi:MAG: hypothetical protein LBD22_05780 [Spirochaetaceae bacterium]|jgi:V/A-type H+-transporting ATPase subunit E|nr:hypothetical protein [Spirochaetaceae bacterium]